MKRIPLLFLLLTTALMGRSQAYIDVCLEKEMAQRAHDEQIEVVVLMHSQYDRTLLNHRVAYCPNRAERRERVVHALYFAATKDVVQDLAKRPDIAMIGLDHKENLIPETTPARAASPDRETTPNVYQVNADQVWALGYRG